MDVLIQSLRDKANSNIPFDLEILIDEIVSLQKQINDQHKEELHQQGRGFQQFYDSIVLQLREMVSGEILRLKSEPVSEQSQYFYKTFKAILNILNDIPVVFE